MKKIKSADQLTAMILSYIIISFMAILCLMPFILVISGSFTSNEAILRSGFGLIPSEFSWEAYAYAFRKPEEILNAYKVTIIVTLTGTAVSVYLSSMSGYVLTRPEYRHRNKVAFFFFFTTIFSGGLVPWYVLCVKYLHFKEMPYMALILPMLMNFFYIVILRSFISNIPESIIDSARIDGAGDYCIYRKFIIPMSKAAIATVVLFTAMGYWNDYFNPMLFVTKAKYHPLQYYLYQIISKMQSINSQMMNSAGSMEYPSEAFKMAMTVIATGPIVLVYPFIQKYLVKGVTVGAVKG